ncbi:MAG: CBS domain-containing protein, partial [Anaerolineales bacterium]|nr:CBS domain-containing protein [Anaerolineales bacterium]
VFEMSNDYQLILPLMLATVLSTLLAEHLFRDSIYTFKLRLRGITLQRGRDMDLMQTIQVSEAMTVKPYLVPLEMPVKDLGVIFEQTHSHSFPVVDEEMRLAGMVSIRDYERMRERPAWEHLKVKDIATLRTLLVAFDDEPLSDALQRIAIRDVNKLPVVSRSNPQKVVGVIRRRDIIKAYKTSLARRADQQIEEDKTRLRRLGDVEFMEVEIAPNCRSAHQTIARLGPSLPDGCVVVSISRQDNLLIPHGDTVLLPGDQVNIFVRRVDENKLRECLLGETQTA